MEKAILSFEGDHNPYAFYHQEGKLMFAPGLETWLSGEVCAIEA